MTENVEVDARLDLIRDLTSKLRKGMSQNEFDTVTGHIEALCRHRGLPVSTVTENIPSNSSESSSQNLPSLGEKYER